MKSPKPKVIKDFLGHDYVQTTFRAPGQRVKRNYEVTY